MRRLPLLMLLLAACQPQAWVSNPPTGQTCGAEAVQGLIGQPVQALPASGPWKALRILHPGQAATMDFSETRLTVLVDAQDRITSARCE